MPKIPKWLGDTMEVVYQKFIHGVKVKDIQYLDSNLKKIRFSGDFKNIRYMPGNVVKIRVNDTAFRHYTISAFDAESGSCEILFYLHEKGPGSEWAATLKVGETVRLLGPGGRLHYMPDQENHFLFGDETSLGWMQCMEHEIDKNNQFFFGFVELDPEHGHWANLADSSVKVVSKSMADPAAPTIAILKEWEDDFWETSDRTVFYLTGRTQSIQAFRKFLLSKGISGRRIKTEPYWADGKSGL